MFDAIDFGKNLFGRCGDQVFDFAGRGARIGDKNIGKGDIDLGFFFAWCNNDGEQTQQQADQRQ